MEISWRFVVKAIVFGVLLAISIKVPLWTAIEEFTDPGTKTRRSTLLVSSYKSPAFTLCFAPPFNASSNLYYDYFLGSTSDFSWHAETPLWNLFYQSSYRIQKDFELKFSYYGTSFTVNDKVLEEGKLSLGDGKEIETILLPTLLEGMCHVFIPNFVMEIHDKVEFFVKFKYEDKPSMVTVYVTAPNEWSLISLGYNFKRFQFQFSNQYMYKFSLEQTEITILQNGNDDCDYGCRFEQCEGYSFDDFIDSAKSWEHTSQYNPCLPFMLKGPYFESSKNYEMCQNYTEHVGLFHFFWYGYSHNIKQDDMYTNDCFWSKRTARYEGNYLTMFAPPGDLKTDLKLGFSFENKVMVKEEEEKFVTGMEFFVAVVGSITAFFDFCLQTYINRIIDFGFNWINSS